MNISQIKKANKAAGQYFFSKDANIRYDSITLPQVYEGEGGVFFVTSEQMNSAGIDFINQAIRTFKKTAVWYVANASKQEVDRHNPIFPTGRAFTVRFFVTDGVNAGHVGTLGEFNKLTRKQAISKAKKAAAGKYSERRTLDDGSEV